MADLKLKIKKQLFKRKVEGQTKAGYIGLHPKEASLAAELLLEGVCAKLKHR